MKKRVAVISIISILVLGFSLMAGCVGNTQETEGDRPGDQNHIADAETDSKEKTEENL